ncbi:hypothetical protein AAT19DRAFT_10036 [Rhodotorula toruloides]|uniref:N-acetyltransferase domain-containing protein n=1 Tax=Rhodotorula toruloides TaxID=5286 RepID=A0A2T0A1Q4_RHOTO|nr:hypothetical protein AAT19DRAFT_10036 [Rhodotorula toruloides]
MRSRWSLRRGRMSSWRRSFSTSWTFCGRRTATKGRMSVRTVSHIVRLLQLMLFALTDLNILVVSPKAQRKGVGRALIQWGCDEADRLGVPAWLEASERASRPLPLPHLRLTVSRQVEGFGLYQKMGFERAREDVYAGPDNAISVSCLRRSRVEQLTVANARLLRLLRSLPCADRLARAPRRSTASNLMSGRCSRTRQVQRRCCCRRRRCGTAS